jgi:hypothetical protein
MSEAAMVSAAIATLNLQRDVLAFRCNTGVARLYGSHVRYGLGNGAPDVLAVLAPWGHLVGLEGKLPGRDLDPEQRIWASELQAHGGSFGVFRSVADALAIVAAIRSSLQSGAIAQAPDIALRLSASQSASQEGLRPYHGAAIERAAMVNVAQGQCKARGSR